MRGRVAGTLALGAVALAIGFRAWHERQRAPQQSAQSLAPSAQLPEDDSIRPEIVSPSPLPNRDRLLAQARSDATADRSQAGADLGRLLDGGQDPELLDCLHALALRDPNVEVRRAAMTQLVFRNDPSSFDILVEAVTSVSNPQAVRLRAIELMERPGRKDYGLFLRNHGCPDQEVERLASQRRDRARVALLSAASATSDPQVEAAIRRSLGKLDESARAPKR